MPIPLEFDGPRRIRPDEFSASRRLSRICFNDLPDTGDDDAPLSPEHEPQETYLFAHAGRPVSQISIFHTPLRIYDGRIRVGSIGGVCTHPDYRGYRLASRLMEHCTRQLVQGGAELMSISGGRGLYTRLGNVPSGRYAAFTLRSAQLPPPPNTIRLREIRPSNGPWCSRLYQAEPAHFTRTFRTYEKAFRPHEIGFQAEGWAVELDGQPAAYLLLNTPWDFIDRPEAGVRSLCEFAGSRVALAGALAAALNQPGIHEIHIPVPWQDADLIHLLCQHAQPEWIALPEHTMRIINFPALMTGLRPYLQASLPAALRRGLRFAQSGPLLAGDSEGLCSITRGPDRLELPTAAMTSLVMGSPDAAPGEAAGALGDILPALFPLPSFLPGLDYH